MSYRRAAPVYAHAHNRLLRVLGKTPVGSRLAVQSELARLCGASRTTVHHLLASLRRGGLISTEKESRLLRAPVRKDFLPEPASLSRRDEVEQSIMAMLVDGRLKPGQRFSELGLARAHGVTTGTIREALLNLSTLGVFAKSARKQWEVAKIDAGMLHDIMDLRVQFECFALERHFSRGGDPAPFVRLLEEMRVIEKMKKVPRAEFFRLDAEFHRLILEAGQNRYLGAQLRFLSFPLQIQLFHGSFGQALLRKGLREHLALLRAIVGSRRELALERLRRHLETARSTLLGLLAVPQ